METRVHPAEDSGGCGRQLPPRASSFRPPPNWRLQEGNWAFDTNLLGN